MISNRSWKIRQRIENILHLNMNSFRLDRTAFKAQTLKEASNHASYYKKLSWQDRLKVAAYLNSIAYNFDLNSPPKMDRTKFSARSISS
jgi:hypothetical protein